MLVGISSLKMFQHLRIGDPVRVADPTVIDFITDATVCFAGTIRNVKKSHICVSWSEHDLPDSLTYIRSENFNKKNREI